MDFSSVNQSGIYTDLIREFLNNDHKVYIVSPTERRKHELTRLVDYGNYQMLKLRIGNTQKTNVIEKGISTIALESIFLRGIKKYYSNIKFDLIIYTTPPITLFKAVDYIKKRDNAATYLLLKDIFPQGAVDLGLLSITGINGQIYRYFRNVEKKLYSVSDYIGCM